MTTTRIVFSCCVPQPSYWTYDANGNVRHDHNKEYFYDAAGNKRLVFETTTVGVALTRKLWLYQDYDGHGVRAKRVEQEQINQGSYVFKTSYYLRSSVLNGKVIMELNEGGQRRESNVYANGVLLVQQKDNQLTWADVDPVTSSSRGNPAGRLEFDPLGNDVPPTDPSPPEQTPDYEYAGSYGQSGNPYDGASGCMIDGQQVPCSLMLRMTAFGSGRGIGSSDGSAASAIMLSQVWVDDWDEVKTPSGTASQDVNGNWTGSVTTAIRNVGQFATVSGGGIATAIQHRHHAALTPRNPYPND